MNTLKSRLTMKSTFNKTKLLAEGPITTMYEFHPYLQ